MRQFAGPVKARRCHYHSYTTAPSHRYPRHTDTQTHTQTDSSHYTSLLRVDQVF